VAGHARGDPFTYNLLIYSLIALGFALSLTERRREYTDVA